MRSALRLTVPEEALTPELGPLDVEKAIANNYT